MLIGINVGRPLFMNTQEWKPVVCLTGSAPTPRHSHAAVVHGTSLYCFGGYDGQYRAFKNVVSSACSLLDCLSARVFRLLPQRLPCFQLPDLVLDTCGMCWPPAQGPIQGYMLRQGQPDAALRGTCACPRHEGMSSVGAMLITHMFAFV